jgi:Flp pilus assembly protein TadG
MIQAKCRLVADRSGVAALEFALIAPVYLAFVLGIIAFGYYFTVEIAVTVAASEGARASVGALSTDTPTAVAKTAAVNVLNGYAPLITASSATVNAAASGTSMSVTVSYPLPSALFTLMPFTLSSPSATSTVQYSAF